MYVNTQNRLISIEFLDFKEIALREIKKVIGLTPITFLLTYTLIELPALAGITLPRQPVHAVTPFLVPKDVSAHVVVLVSCNDEKTNGFVSAPDKHSTRLDGCQ